MDKGTKTERERKIPDLHKHLYVNVSSVFPVKAKYIVMPLSKKGNIALHMSVYRSVRLSV